jgi:hypothetical protein
VKVEEELKGFIHARCGESNEGYNALGVAFGQVRLLERSEALRVK